MTNENSQIIEEQTIASLKEVSVRDLFKSLREIKKLKTGQKYWFGISGSWRETSQGVEMDVRKTVGEIIRQGGGIITGGALNVDWFAIDEVLRIDARAEHIRVFLPTTLELYATHYRSRAEEGIITREQAEQLIYLLEKLKTANPLSLIEHSEIKVINKVVDFQINTEIINASDAVIGFHVNNSEGVGDALIKAVHQQKLVSRIAYTIK